MALTQISTAGVKDDAVTSGKIPANAVGSSEIAANAVTTAKIADDAVTNAKLANSAVNTLQLETGAVTAPKLANNACTTDKIPDGNVTSVKIADEAITLAKLAHGTSSNNGKFLRANNGADPSFESIPSPAITGINGAGNNRLITSDGGTTVTAEDSVTFNGSQLDVISATIRGDAFICRSNVSTPTADVSLYRSADNTMGLATASTERMRIMSNGRVGINETSPTHQFQVSQGTTAIGFSRDANNPQLVFDSNNLGGAGIIQAYESSGGGGFQFFTKDTGGTLRERLRITNAGGVTFNGDAGQSQALDDYEEGTFTPVLKGVNGGGTLTGSTGAGSGGNYTKIGNRVTFSFYFANPSGSNPSGYLYFEMPFTAASSNAYNGEGGCVTYTRNINPGSGRMFAVNAIAGTNRLYLTNVSVAGQGETYYQDISNDSNLGSMIFKASVSFVAS